MQKRVMVYIVIVFMLCSGQNINIKQQRAITSKL